MPCDTFVSVKQVRAFTIYGALGHGGECTPAKARGPVWETWRPVTHSTYPAHFPGPSWLRSQESRFRMPAHPTWAGTSRTYWPHVLQLRSEEGYLTSGSVPHRTLGRGPETNALSTVLSLTCVSSSDQLFCNENRKPEGQAHSKGSVTAHCENSLPNDRTGERGGLLALTGITHILVEEWRPAAPAGFLSLLFYFHCFIWRFCPMGNTSIWAVSQTPRPPIR